MWVYTRSHLNGIMRAVGSGLGADSINLEGYRLGLLKAAYAPTVDSKYGDVSASVADFAGYGAVTIGALSDPFIGTGGATIIEASAKLFRPDDDTIPNTIYAGILLGSGSESLTLKGVEVLDEPVPLPNEDYQLTYVPRFALPSDADYGQSLVSP